MKVDFTYDFEKDKWCLLNYGKSSMNSKSATKTYSKLIEVFGDGYADSNVDIFIDTFKKENNVDVEKQASLFQEQWNSIENEYHKRAQKIFGVSLQGNVIAYLTINNRCPYSIPQNYFFVSVTSQSANKTAMHELWHFYTWYKFGVKEESQLGKEKYNKIKEALTVLLNVIYPDLLGSIQDIGYPQHQELREQILEYWNQHEDIQIVWEKLI
jgi:hypothetical protein